jgi:hypothetical protein
MDKFTLLLLVDVKEYVCWHCVLSYLISHEPLNPKLSLSQSSTIESACAVNREFKLPTNSCLFLKRLK